MNTLREYIRGLLIEGTGMKYLYRGMTLDVLDPQLATDIRKLARRQPTGLGDQEAARIILGLLGDRGVGESWTTSKSVAANFADAWGAKNRGKRLHFIFTASVPEDAGYDPQAAGEEPGMFYDEQEVAFKKGDEIPVTVINVFIDDGNEFGKLNLKFRKVWAGPPIMVKA